MSTTSAMYGNYYNLKIRITSTKFGCGNRLNNNNTFIAQAQCPL